MKVSWLKLEGDHQNFRIAEKLGMHVEYLKNPEQVDERMRNLTNEKYDTIVLSNELAGFSEDMIKKYQYDETIRIIISPR